MGKTTAARLRVCLLAALAWLSAWPALAASLEQFRVNPLAGEQLVLEMEFDQPPAVTERLTQDPVSLVLRLPGASSALLENRIPIERQGISTIEVRRAGAALEVVIPMSRVQPYRVRQEGKLLQVLLGAGVSATSGAGKPLPPGAINGIAGIDFRRGAEGQAQVVIALDRAAAAVDLQKRGQRLEASFHNTHIPDLLLKTYDVTDFATLANRIHTRRERENVVITVEADGEFVYQYDQRGREFVIELARPARAVSASRPGKRYGGKPISMNFQDIPVRTALQLIADFNNFNLVTTDSVQGNLTLRLDGVPWEQALDTILQVRGLDKRLDGNILLVAPAAELAQQEQQQLENRQAKEVLAPLETEFLQVNYAKAVDVVALLTNESTRLLSERGAIAVDDRTNILVIKDTRENIENIRRMLSLLDIPIKQVVIEARMVTINEGFEEAFGVNWEYRNDTSGEHNSTEGNLNVNLPITSTGGSIGLQIAKLSDGTILDLELAALERENRGEIIASPRVTTSNQKPALIEQGAQVPYSSSSGEGGTEVQFQDAVLSLKVTPQITPDNRVVLDLTVTQDSIGEEVPQATGGVAVAIDTQSITTQVLVNDGETLVLGGIFQQVQSRTVTKVPLLGDIPVVGRLFKSTSDTNRKRELIIFVTPRIVHDSA
ncbi:type IV pilus secretin PilQ family protein [Oceanimonas sp. CHS3-5]|uniref:type IV pilus secretin PilQ n=1 Tax=Oceanimonas sp. CHS3-5 TaxID=3068186 RepID=UPI00273E6AF6|nr:type IV pilus secretin PilQ family protein [Oceanimonas sp. CHS3-5]MDP5292233.1 type IV pilus secretin PilQ family protein [Oceanimonas sp. CHS3-5]